MKNSMRKRCLTVLSGVLMATAAAALTACGGGGGGNVGEVSDSVWQERLNFNVDACKSCTVTQCTEPKYGKDEIEEYGEYDRTETIYYIDFENEIIHSIMEREWYDNSEKEFTKYSREEYYFKYKDGYYQWAYTDGYYQWENYNSAQAVVTVGTKAGFIKLSETPANMASSFNTYARIKTAFKYNAETQSYELVQIGTMKISVQFLDDGGVRSIQDITSATQEETSLTGVDKTTVTVPDNVKADIDAFIAAPSA